MAIRLSDAISLLWLLLISFVHQICHLPNLLGYLLSLTVYGIDHLPMFREYYAIKMQENLPSMFHVLFHLIYKAETSQLKVQILIRGSLSGNLFQQKLLIDSLSECRIHAFLSHICWKIK